MTLDMGLIASVAESAALYAGRAVVDHWKGYSLDVQSKGAADIVSAADLASHRLISARIRSAFPSHRILSEEDRQTDQFDFSGPLWVIDPIDGTTNYVRGHPHFGISVAFAFDGVVWAGCVHAPALSETFAAIRGGGATLNRTPIKVSTPEGLSRSVVSTGFPHENKSIKNLMQRVECLLRACQDIRRSASPVLDICYVAMGRLDAHIESLFAWDVAASGLIATEAGAVRSNLVEPEGNIPIDLFGEEILISAPKIHRPLCELLKGGMGREKAAPLSEFSSKGSRRAPPP